MVCPGGTGIRIRPLPDRGSRRDAKENPLVKTRILVTLQGDVALLEGILFVHGQAS